MAKPTDTDEYISGCPDAVQPALQKIRETIHEAVPDAPETISYAMPAFKLGGRYCVFFAAWKDHLSVYPVPKASDIQEEIKPYLGGRGTLKFKLGEPVPYGLISKVAVYLAEEAKAAAKDKHKD